MGIGVARLDRPFRRRQVLAAIELIVLVAGPFGEHRPEDFEVRRDRPPVVTRQTRRQALLEIARGRVKRVIQVARVRVEQVAMRRPQLFANVDDVEPGPRRQFERDLDWRNSHGYGPLV